MDNLPVLMNLPALITGAQLPAGQSTCWEDAPQWARDRAMERLAAVEEARAILIVPGKGKQKAITRATGQNYGTVWRWMQLAEEARFAAYQTGEDVTLAQAQALMPHWGRTRNRCLAFSPEALRWVIQRYANQSRLNLYYVYEQLLPIARASGWKVGSYRSLLRILDKILSPSLLAHARLGDKKWEAAYVTKILRDYDEIWPNFGWVSDHHIFDVFVKVGSHATGIREVRPWVTAMLDLKSRSLMGWCISTQPSSQTIALALRHAILPKDRPDCPQHGLPLSIYLDNGKDYTCEYLAGKPVGSIDYPDAIERFTALGTEPQYIDLAYDPKDKAWKKRVGDEELVVKQIKVGGVFARLGINSRYAIVYHPWAKPIERTFRNVVQNFSRSLPGWCGSNPQERPEKLTWERKRGLLLTWEQFCQAWEAYVVIEYNLRPQRTEGMRGRSPTEVFLQETQGEHRPQVVVPELLDFALLKKQQVHIHPWGFWLQGEKFELAVPSTPEGAAALDQLIGRKVEVLYEPEFKTVKVFREGRFCCNAQLLRWASWMPNSDLVFKDKIRLQQLQRKHNRKLLKLIQSTCGAADTAEPEPKRLPSPPIPQLPLPLQEETPLTFTPSPREGEGWGEGARAQEDVCPQAGTIPPEIANRPDLWLGDHAHYLWCIRREAYGLLLEEADREFCREFKATEQYEFGREVYEGEAAYCRQVAIKTGIRG